MAQKYYVVTSDQFEIAQAAADVGRELPYSPRFNADSSQGLYKIDDENLPEEMSELVGYDTDIDIEMGSLRELLSGEDWSPQEI